MYLYNGIEKAIYDGGKLQGSLHVRLCDSVHINVYHTCKIGFTCLSYLRLHDVSSFSVDGRNVTISKKNKKVSNNLFFFACLRIVCTYLSVSCIKRV